MTATKYVIPSSKRSILIYSRAVLWYAIGALLPWLKTLRECDSIWKTVKHIKKNYSIEENELIRSLLALDLINNRLCLSLALRELTKMKLMNIQLIKSIKIVIHLRFSKSPKWRNESLKLILYTNLRQPFNSLIPSLIEYTKRLKRTLTVLLKRRSFLVSHLTKQPTLSIIEYWIFLYLLVMAHSTTTILFSPFKHWTQSSLLIW